MREIELARRYHFLLLESLPENLIGKVPDNVRLGCLSESYRKYDKMASEINYGRVSEDKISFLESLPSWKEWSLNREAVQKIISSDTPFDDDIKELNKMLNIDECSD